MLHTMDALHNKSILHILPCMSGPFHTIYTLYVTTFYTIHLSDTFKFVYQNVSDSIPAWFISLGQSALHNKLLFYVQVHYVSTLQTIQLHDAFHFVYMDAPYNIPARYSPLCTLRFSIQYTYITHTSLFFIISTCQDSQYQNLVQMCAKFSFVKFLNLLFLVYWGVVLGGGKCSTQPTLPLQKKYPGSTTESQ